MNRAVLLSIRPQYCELIASGKKTVEVRKTRPKIETPFKGYIYCTLNGSVEFFKKMAQELGEYEAVCKWNREKRGLKKGKVIGEFVCDEIHEWNEDEPPSIPLKETCLSYSEIRRYGKGAKKLYMWHIADLVIYDKPKELSSVIVERYPCLARLRRPPQSWCYVEKLEGY